METPSAEVPKQQGLVNRLLSSIEVIGNKLPDPAMLFLFTLIIVWILSALLAPHGQRVFTAVTVHITGESDSIHAAAPSKKGINLVRFCRPIGIRG